MDDRPEPRLAAERQESILGEARLRGFVKVVDVAQRLGVSTVTVRRDIAALVDAGRLTRVHGGATLPPAAVASRPLATIGMVLPTSSYYYRSVIAGAEEAASREAVRLVLAVSHYDSAEEERLVARMLRARVDALLVATTVPLQGTKPGWMDRVGVPTIFVERRWDGPGAESVRSDHRAGSRLVVEHLAEHGHSRVGLAVRGETPTSRLLVQGFGDETGPGRAVRSGFEPVELAGAAAGVAERDRCLSLVLDRCAATDTRAVLVHTDEDAVALLGLASDRGLRVPEDLSIIAYDDEVAALAPVPLTAVAPPKEDLGRAAVSLAIRRLGAAGDLATQHAVLVPRLRERSSVATTVRSDRA